MTQYHNKVRNNCLWTLLSRIVLKGHRYAPVFFLTFLFYWRVSMPWFLSLFLKNDTLSPHSDRYKANRGKFILHSIFRKQRCFKNALRWKYQKNEINVINKNSMRTQIKIEEKEVNNQRVLRLFAVRLQTLISRGLKNTRRRNCLRTPLDWDATI